MITLSKSGSTVTFTFDDNSGYLQNGTIDVPVNSLSLILDESNMATFRKSASNDIFVSATLGEFGMSKSELEAFYKANMVGSSGVSPEEVQEMIDESISGKADSVSAVSSAEYVSSSTTINFKNADGTVISSIDASDFVIDGMIDNVSIETISGASYLVIDFNTASGKEDIQIPLTDIFDPSNYYTKAEVDAAISGLAESSAVTLEISEAVSGKADSSSLATVATSGSYNDLLDKPTIPTVPTSNTAFTNDAGYITSDALSGYSESSAVTAEINAAVSGKQDTLIAGDNITISGNVISATGGGGGGTVDQSIISGSTNAVAGGAVFNATYVESGYTGWESVDFDGMMATDIHAAQIKMLMPPPFTDGMNLTVNCDGGQMIMFTYSENDGNWSYEDSEEVISEFSYEDPEFNLTVIEGVLIDMLEFNEPVDASVEKYAEDYSATPLKTVVQNLENAVVSAVSSVNLCLTGGSFNLSNQHVIQLAFYNNAGTQPSTYIPLADDLKVANSALTTDIKVPLGSGWTAVTFDDETTKTTEEINANQVKVVLTGTPSQDNSIWIQDGEDNWELIMYDNDAWRNDTSFISGITVSGNDLYLTASEGNVIKKIAADENPELIDSVQKYGVMKQALIPYVQETKSDLGGLKLQQVTQAEYDALVSGGTIDNSTLYVITNS